MDGEIELVLVGRTLLDLILNLRLEGWTIDGPGLELAMPRVRVRTTNLRVGRVGLLLENRLSPLKGLRTVTATLFRVGVGFRTLVAGAGDVTEEEGVGSILDDDSVVGLAEVRTLVLRTGRVRILSPGRRLRVNTNRDRKGLRTTLVDSVTGFRVFRTFGGIPVLERAGVASYPKLELE